MIVLIIAIIILLVFALTIKNVRFKSIAWTLICVSIICLLSVNTYIRYQFNHNNTYLIQHTICDSEIMELSYIPGTNNYLLHQQDTIGYCINNKIYYVNKTKTQFQKTAEVPYVQINHYSIKKDTLISKWVTDNCIPDEYIFFVN